LPLYAVDINSQFEVAPAIKDIEKIKAFKAIL
jgi:phosphoribosylanthranilate isomerase